VLSAWCHLILLFFCSSILHILFPKRLPMPEGLCLQYCGSCFRCVNHSELVQNKMSFTLFLDSHTLANQRKKIVNRLWKMTPLTLCSVYAIIRKDFVFQKPSPYPCTNVPPKGRGDMYSMNTQVLYSVFKRNFVDSLSNPTGYVFICVFVLISSITANGREYKGEQKS